MADDGGGYDEMMIPLSGYLARKRSDYPSKIYTKQSITRQ